MTAQEFLDAFSAQVGVPSPTAAESEALLEVASIAARSSERLAAPLACWMGGASAISAADLLAAARRAAAGESEAG